MRKRQGKLLVAFGAVAFVTFALQAALLVWLDAVGSSSPLVQGLIGAAVVGFLVTPLLHLALRHGARQDTRKLEEADAELRKQRESLEDHNRMLRTLLDGIPTPVFIKDASFRYIAFNPAYARFVGLPNDRILGRTSFDVIADPALARRVDRADRVLFSAGGTQEYDARVPHADGSYHDVSFRKAVYHRKDGSRAGVVGVMLDVSKRKELERELRKLSLTDPLTGLDNRASFIAYLDEALAQAWAMQKRLAVLFIDLDGFKAVNDTYGHEEGDRLLQRIAHGLRESVRETDVSARLGGDEFAILLSNPVNVDIVRRIAGRVVEAVRAPSVGREASGSVTASVGVAFGPEPAMTADVLIHRADTAMYTAKNRGKNRVTVWTPALEAGDETTEVA